MFQMGERDNFQTGPIVLQRHDVRHDDDGHGGARRGDVPHQVASHLGAEGHRRLGAQSRRRDQGRPRRAWHARRLPRRAQFRDRRAPLGATRGDGGRGRNVHDGAGDVRGSRPHRSRRQREQPAGLGRRVPRHRRIAGVALQHGPEAGRAWLRDVEEPERAFPSAAARSGRRSRSTPIPETCTSPPPIRRPICRSTSVRATTSTPTR